jgi:hypothetical protein
MKKRHFLFLLIIFQFPIIISGQKGYLPGYIISNKNDTLRGFINLNSNYENSSSCNFIEGDDQNPKTYSPDDIKGYRIENSRFYLSKDINIDSTQQRVFLEYLVDGIVNLYYLKDLKGEYYFIEKDTLLFPLSNEESTVTLMVKGAEKPLVEKTFLRNSNQYRRILTYLFQDSPIASRQIPTIPFTYKSLIKITKDYHNSVCDYNCIDFTKSTKQGLFIEPSVGIINAWMGLRLETSKTFAPDFKPFYAFKLRIKPFKGYSGWDLLVGVNYSSNSFEGIYDALWDDLYPIQYHVYADYSILRIPLGVDYSFTSKKLQPFLSLTGNSIIILNPDYEVIRIDNSSIVETPFRKFQLGLSPGLGFKYVFKNDSYLILKDEFEYRIPGAGFGYVLDNQVVYSNLLSIGYGLKIK